MTSPHNPHTPATPDQTPGQTPDQTLAQTSAQTPAWIVTGNLTESGSVVWRAADGSWSPSVQMAGHHADAASAAAVAADANRLEQRNVCGVYTVEVRTRDGAIELLSARERIRAAGPTIRLRRPDPGTQGG